MAISANREAGRKFRVVFGPTRIPEQTCGVCRWRGTATLRQDRLTLSGGALPQGMWAVGAGSALASSLDGVLAGAVVDGVGTNAAKSATATKARLEINPARQRALCDRRRRTISIELPGRSWLAVRLRGRWGLPASSLQFQQFEADLRETFGERMTEARLGRWTKRRKGCGLALLIASIPVLYVVIRLTIVALWP